MSTILKALRRLEADRSPDAGPEDHDPTAVERPGASTSRVESTDGLRERLLAEQVAAEAAGLDGPSTEDGDGARVASGSLGSLAAVGGWLRRHALVSAAALVLLGVAGVIAFALREPPRGDVASTGLAASPPSPAAPTPSAAAAPNARPGSPPAPSAPVAPAVPVARIASTGKAAPAKPAPTAPEEASPPAASEPRREVSLAAGVVAMPSDSGAGGSLVASPAATAPKSAPAVPPRLAARSAASAEASPPAAAPRPPSPRPARAIAPSPARASEPAPKPESAAPKVATTGSTRTAPKASSATSERKSPEVATVTPERGTTRPAASAPERKPAKSASSSPETPRIATAPIPDVEVVRTAWHPDPDRRSARIRLLASGELVTLAEGDAAGALVIKEITPSSVLFSTGDVEIRRRVGD